MTTNQQPELASILGNLNRLNNDRMAAYHALGQRLKDHDARLVIQKLLLECRQVHSTIVTEIFKQDSLPNLSASTWVGRGYRWWLLAAEWLTGGPGEGAAFRSCRWFEQRMFRACKAALRSPGASRELNLIFKDHLRTTRGFNHLLKGMISSTSPSDDKFEQDRLIRSRIQRTKVIS